MMMMGGRVVFAVVVGVIIGTLVPVYVDVIPSFSLPRPVPEYVP